MSLDWTSLLIGLVLGWLLQWALDYFFWRDRHSGGEEIEALQGELDAATMRIAELEASLNDAEAERDEWEASYNSLAEQLALLQALESEVGQYRTNYADLEAEHAQLRGDYDELQHWTDEARIRAIGRLTAIDGIDEYQAGRLYDAGIVSSDDLLITDDDAVQAALDLPDEDYHTWSDQVKAALAAVGLGYVATQALEEEEDPEMRAAGVAVGAAALDQDDEGSPDVIVEEVLETYDFDDDGQIDLVIETTTEGLDVDHDGEIDVVLEETIEADILDEDAVAAAEAEVEAEIDAELEAMAAEELPEARFDESIIVDELDSAVMVAALSLGDDADDFTVIQGIGPKISEKLAASGIITFAALAVASDDDLDLAIQPQSWQKYPYDNWRSQAKTFAEVPLPVIEGDDLQKIEGIGPKYAALLREADIMTYAELADTEPDRLAEIIGAPAWRKIDYDAWIAQSGLAAAGDQEQLSALQDELGRHTDDNLLLIHGLGESYNNALKKGGISSFQDLAQCTADEVEAIVVAAGLRRANFGEWIEEAKLRASGKRVARRTRTYEDAIVVRCPQDLESIEGVGTMYERRLYEAGIGSFWEVAQISDDELSDILEVMPFQDVDLANIRASAMALALETGTVNQVWDGSQPDDYEPFEGLGVIYERRLYNAGYCTYEAMAGATVEELEAICKPPAFQKPDFEQWIATAKKIVEAKGADEG
jgi:predicted flap endonuclease-1-like 5' DNA nuclease